MKPVLVYQRNGVDSIKYFVSNSAVYSLQYHLVWCTKYRKPVLTESIQSSLISEIRNIARNSDFEIVELNTDKDHIHMLIYLKPTHFIPTVVKQLKGSTSRTLRSKHKELRRIYYGGSLWSPSYFISSVSDTTEEVISRYIQNQGKE